MEKDNARTGSGKSIIGKSTTWKIRDVGGEKEINFFVVVEMFRFLFYLWFVIIMITGILLTLIFTEEKYSEIIKTIFGSINVCVFFDFPPSIYVLPSLYAIWPVIIFIYAILSIFRAWISKEEKKLSKLAFILYSMVFVYFTLSAAVFSTSIAVQPDLKKPVTIKLHTLPFTNLVMALTVLQISITWFGFEVSWKGLEIPKLLKFLTVTFLITLVATSTIKIIQHINGVFGYDYDESKGIPKDHGLIWSVQNGTMSKIGQIADMIWMLSILFWPMCQSGYEMWRKFDTHGLIITIGDNRDSDDAVETLDIEGSETVTGIKNSGFDMDEEIRTKEDEIRENDEDSFHPNQTM